MSYAIFLLKTNSFFIFFSSLLPFLSHWNFQLETLQHRQDVLCNLFWENYFILKFLYTFPCNIIFAYTSCATNWDLCIFSADLRWQKEPVEKLNLNLKVRIRRLLRKFGECLKYFNRGVVTLFGWVDNIQVKKTSCHFCVAIKRFKLKYWLRSIPLK